MDFFSQRLVISYRYRCRIQSLSPYISDITGMIRTFLLFQIFKRSSGTSIIILLIIFLYLEISKMY